MGNRMSVQHTQWEIEGQSTWKQNWDEGSQSENRMQAIKSHAKSTQEAQSGLARVQGNGVPTTKRSQKPCKTSAVPDLIPCTTPLQML